MALVGIALSLLAWLAARKADGLPRWVRHVALAAFLGDGRADPARWPHGDPRAPPARGDVALPARARRARRSRSWWCSRPGATAPGSASSAGAGLAAAVAGVGVAACAVMVVTGAVVTASGPHPGGEDTEVERLGLGITDTVYVHVRAAAVFGIGFLVVGWFVLRLPHAAAGRRPARRRRCSSSSARR